jgi:hypothetical protein
MSFGKAFNSTPTRPFKQTSPFVLRVDAKARPEDHQLADRTGFGLFNTTQRPGQIGTAGSQNG